MQQLQQQQRTRPAAAGAAAPRPRALLISRAQHQQQRARPTSSALASASASASAAPAPSTTEEAAAAAFAAAVTGEWEGVTATFTPSGEALDLPDRYVPQAFRDWDMVPKDWQTQCSVPPLGAAAADAAAAAAHASSSSSPPPLRYAARRMMPTVGCEADAVAFTEDMTVIGGGGDDASPSSSSSSEAAGAAAPAALLAALAADGAYASAPARLPVDGRATVRLESCFPLPETSDKNGRPERLRVVQTLTRDWTQRAEGEPGSSGGGGGGAAAAAPPLRPAALLRLEGVELHREFRDGPFTGRKELLGCGGGSPPISKLERTPRAAAPSSAAAAGAAAAAAAASSSSSSGAALPANAPPGSLAAPAGITTLLPLGAWSHVRRAALGGGGGGGAGLIAEAGVLLGGGARRRVISFEFAADGAFSGASIAEEDV